MQFEWGLCLAQFSDGNWGLKLEQNPGTPPCHNPCHCSPILGAFEGHPNTVTPVVTEVPHLPSRRCQDVKL